jgi:hypothetical protein
MKTAVILLAILCSFADVRADEVRETYVARLSRQDHFNSNGQRLQSAAAIIRQDRANFHKFGRRDSEDEHDVFFASTSNRALFEKMLERGSSEPGALRSIVNGTPLIKVVVFKNHVVVMILD